VRNNNKVSGDSIRPMSPFSSWRPAQKSPPDPALSVCPSGLEIDVEALAVVRRSTIRWATSTSTPPQHVSHPAAELAPTTCELIECYVGTNCGQSQTIWKDVAVLTAFVPAVRRRGRCALRGPNRSESRM